MNIFAVVPVYNENSKNLSNVLAQLSHYVNKIIVIDDGSTESIDRHTLPHNAILLRHSINRGQGAALQTGTDYAVDHQADIIIHFDSDGQHRVEDIEELITPIKEGQVDFVFGSRFLGKENKIPFTKKYIILPISKIINRIFSGLKLSDVHNGLRAFRATIAPQIRLSQDRMAHNTEYPALVKQHSIRYTEVPIQVIYHHYGQGIGGGFSILKELLSHKIIK